MGLMLVNGWISVEVACHSNLDIEVLFVWRSQHDIITLARQSGHQ